MPRKKPKQNSAASPHESLIQDRCETPAYALDPLLPYLERFKGSMIWESACGSGRIVRVLERHGHRVIASDILQDLDFFDTIPSPFDLQVTNPPYTIKARWIERCYQLRRPFALLVPLETIGTAIVQGMMEQYGAELLLLNRRVDFIMPNIGEVGSSATFPVVWYCWQILPGSICYGRITKRLEGQATIFDPEGAAI